jgi:16S rRNA (cytosine1402-N4)-methyltransferase
MVSPLVHNLVHVPVMLNEILTAFEPVLRESSQALRYFDGTFGRGGHLRALLENNPKVTALATDRDLEALNFAEKNFSELLQNGRLQLRHANFSEFSPEWGEFDMMLLDLGVSSPQLDQSQRGFSFYNSGPLDMRMDNSKGFTAADVVNTYDEEDLIRIFKDYGEIFKPYRVVRAIVNDRKTKPYKDTLDLASLVERVEGWRRKGFHPATQFFMALRLEVNQELQSVSESLEKLAHGLKPKGRLCVLTFHSLEDRIVKNAFKDFADLGKPVNKKVIVPGREEEVQNPRARSAKLRIFERNA